MKTHLELIDFLIASGSLYSSNLIKAFRRHNRNIFVPQELQSETYGDYPLSIGMGQTISQPTTVAIMLELLQPVAGNRVLDIGSGSGWTTALLASAVEPNGFVEGIERIPSLVEYGKSSLHKAGIINASIEFASPSALGKPGHLYDRILVSASADKLPSLLLDQLKNEGTLVLPIGHSIWRITKGLDGKLTLYEFPGFRFVPLIASE
ncbi:MAG: L-isoaspartyl protein carboxyl methyltransferase [Sulfuricurvum sp.]|nr:L-isoaspartyl protein carboxyl methyltransferase [Sulfuricurvum sp.]